MVRVPARTGTGDPPGLNTASAPRTVAAALRVEGVVQGVGFRPFAHRMAVRFGLAGTVRNASTHVLIEVEGAAAAIAAFAAALREEAPPLAHITRMDRTDLAPAGRDGFVIAASRLESEGGQPVSPDAAMCPACEAELLDPAGRRHRYPFITCTDCGPRFSVIEAMPYDRERTSMRAFVQCPACLAEYRDPADRRYHSETNSCPACGPSLWLADRRGRPLTESYDSAVERAAVRLRAGEIVAIRGLGGFHRACDATDDAVVRRLRARKRREAKPLAVMVLALADARALVQMDDAAAELLESPERPIVVLPLRPGALPLSVAPGLASAGIMLAYTPLHHLLLEAAGRPLVMTSGNLSDEPIAIGNDEAVARLADIADVFLLHDREIVARYDDSVVRADGSMPIMLRRSRGHAPLPFDLPVPTPRPLLAVGPHLKNTLTLASGARAYVSQHVGDLEDLEALAHFGDVLDRLSALFGITPEVAVRDLHPGYLSTRLAAELGLPVLAVQHHHAHIAAVMAEHGRTAPVVGLALDGAGYGDDGLTWGAEVLVAGLAAYHRVGQLRYAPMPGGDLAARRPWRAALGYLSLERSLAPAFERAFDGVSDAERRVAERQVMRRLNAPLWSSCGRLFDAAAAVLGLRRSADYEGQAAMELEALAGRRPGRVLDLPVSREDGRRVWDPLPLLAALGSQAVGGADRADLAADLHESLAAAFAAGAGLACDEAEIDTVALGGGCFQNARLLAGVTERLQRRGLLVLVPRRLPPNDGAISLGQAAVAAARLTLEG
jgi:hydrogenase maturation protein HypF